MTKFKHYPVRPKKLTAAFAKKEYDKLLAQLPEAEKSKTPGKWIKLFADWNALKSYIGSEATRAHYYYSKDMSSQTLEAAIKYLREKITPVIDKPEHHLTESFLKSRHKDAIAKRYGEILPLNYEMDLKPMNPINTDLHIKAGDVGTEYEKLLSGATVRVRGEKINISKVRSLLFSPDSALREEAFLAYMGWFIENRKRLADIYTKLVSLRDQMGHNLGFKNYIGLAYLSSGRIGYGESDVAKFRKSVLKHVVPVLVRLYDERAKKLGQDRLRPSDIMYDPDCDLPLGIAPVEQQLDNAEAVFEKLSPVLANHFRFMRSSNLIDLEARPNKQPGAYCTHFSDEQKVIILCNSTGDADDVRVLVHEMGHAFQISESQKIESVDLHTGSAELAEIYSIGMEFLSLPYMDIFFGKTAATKFARHKWVDSLYTICYVCIVDEFQHWVYKNPKADPAQRDERWVELYSKYLPAIDISGYENHIKGRWYAQMHIFVSPFYYIDYALAETAAMQLGMLADIDHSKTAQTYLKLCKLGGTKSFIDALKTANLRSPFEEDLIKDVVNYAENSLL